MRHFTEVTDPLPQKPIDQFWEDRLGLIVANERPLPALAEIERRFAALAESEGRNDPPSYRTIQRRLQKWPAMPETTRNSYRLVRWPEFFLHRNPDLPWEASAAIIELTALLDGRPPLYPLAIWFWRCTLARPSLPAHDRLFGARALMNAEKLGGSVGAIRDAGNRYLTGDWQRQLGPEWSRQGTFATWDAAVDWLEESNGAFTAEERSNTIAAFRDASRVMGADMPIAVDPEATDQ